MVTIYAFPDSERKRLDAYFLTRIPILIQVCCIDRNYSSSRRIRTPTSLIDMVQIAQ
jgi:hypothetical protein